METNNELVKALTLVNIDVAECDRCTPEERRTNYHTKILQIIRLNHPDKHATLSKDSSEFKQFVENTKLLNSIDYESSTVSMNRPQEQAEEASTRP